jgi:DNA polymerase III alpha subunit
MDNTKARLRSTQLADRTLWFDGESSFNPKHLLTVVQRYDVQFVDEVNDLVREYNMHVGKGQELKVKTECNPLSFEWNLPLEYKNLDVVNYILDKHLEVVSGISDEEMEERDKRLCVELLKYKKHGFLDVLRTIIYIINMLTLNNVVWGVGRGSSVSSYVLYVIGVHDVDSFAYELDIDDFLHE